MITPRPQISFARRHRRVLPFLVLSVLLHVVALLVVGDWRRKQTEAESFEARLMQVARFEPRRLAAQRPQTSVTPPLDYRGATPPPEPLEAAAELPEPEPLTPPAPGTALRPVDVATRPETFQADTADAVRRDMVNLLALRDSMRQESLDLMRIQDLARGKDRAVVLVDPTTRRGITGYLQLTRLSIPGAGGGRSGGLEAIARHMRTYSDLLVRVRPQTARLDDPDLGRDPILFFVEGGGEPQWEDWPPVHLTARDRESLEAYLRGGGLLFVEGGSRFLAYMVGVLEELLGRDAGIEPLPVGHPLYSAFYDFPSGFPGEQKRARPMLAGAPSSWYYPGAERLDPVVPTDPISAGEATDLDSPTLPSLGLWGVSLGDTLVAIVSDLRMVDSWAATRRQDDLVVSVNAPSLYAGANLIVHALTRHGTTARRRALPAWVKSRPAAPPEEARAGSVAALSPARVDDYADPGLYDDLDASLAVVRAPLGTPFGRGGVSVRVDGDARVDVLRGSRHAVLLHNLEPGTHWVEVELDGETGSLEVELRGGTVTTVTVGVSRFAMLHSIDLMAQSARVAVGAWRQTFSDLEAEEAFLGDAEALPPALPPAP